MNEPENIRSKELDLLLNSKPGWFVRNGIMLFLILFVAIVISIYFFGATDIKNLFHLRSRSGASVLP